MEIVNFPGLGITFQFSKIAFKIFGIEVYKYAVCIVLGILVALLLARLSKKKFDVDFSFTLEASIFAIIFGTIGARLYYVLFNLSYYTKNPKDILNFRYGGLAIYGGLIFGGLAVYIYTKLRKKNTLDLLDFVVPFVAIAQCIGRFGNFFNIEAYGYETKSFLRMGIEGTAGRIEVHPMFLYEAIIDLAIFIILKTLQDKRAFKGEILLLYCIIYSGFRAILEGFRTDSLMLGNLRISQILSIVIFVVSVVLFIINIRKVKCEKKETNTEKV